MRKEAREVAVELARLEIKLRPLLQRRGDLRNVLQKKLPVGEPEVLEGFLFHTYEKLKTTFDEDGLLAALGDRAREVTVPKLDSEKLDAALKLGRITGEELEPFTHVGVTKVLLVRPSANGNGKENANKQHK